MTKYTPTENDMVDDDPKHTGHICQGCKQPHGTPRLHECDFAAEIHGDYEPACNCCNDCRYQCYLDT